jgi:cellulose 1,4-beta-cellobiosidase
MVKTYPRMLRVAAAGILVGVSAIATIAAPAAVLAESHQANPYVGATQYVNPLWKAEVEAEAAKQSGTLATQMRVVENQPTAVWMDSMGAIAGPSGGMGLAAHLDAALTQKTSAAEVVNVVIYDLPGRDCNALASNGEIPATAAGLTTYETQYIDPIVAILSNSKYASLRIALVIEPDSLPNIVTNSSVAACQTAGPLYESGIEYALNKFHAINNVYNFVDSGHSGWLGWSTNSSGAATEFAKVANATTAKFASIDGFITDTANTTPLQEPFITGTTTCCSNAQVISGTFYQYNPDVDEQSFTADMYTRLVSAGFPSSIGMVIDTSRNGWGGSARPTAASTSTVVDTWVNATKVDKRPHRGAWCNPTGAGLGNFPTATPGGYPNSHLFAYIWAKPPGESDGSSTAIANNQGKGFDRMCDPTYAPPGAGWNGALTGALAGAPLAGQWFSAQFVQLVQNAYPVVGSTQSPTPSSSATSTASPSASASATATATHTASPTASASATATATHTASPTASASATATATATHTASPTASASRTPTPSSGTATCAAAYSISSAWGTGFNVNVTVSNPGTVATKTWKVTWTWSGNQSIVNSWNAAITSSGTAVTATNLSYNGASAPGGNTSFGFQASFSGTNTNPTLTCSAT